MRDGAERVVNYLDDFCVVGKGMEEALRDQSIIMGILRRLGFYMSFRKVSTAATSTRFLGIIIDSVELELRLPEDKLKKMLDSLQILEGRKKVTRRELERVAGLLAHCSKVIRGGRTFTRRIYDVIGRIREPFYKVRLSDHFHLQ